jgi:hypothetical protein
MKLGSTLFLKAIVYFFGVAVFVLCLLIIKFLLTEDIGGYTPILIGMLAAALPFFIGIRQTLKLLRYVGQNKAFSKMSLKSLNIIKYCGIIIGSMYGLGMPYIFKVADRDDAPGVVLLGLIFTFAPLVVAVLAGVSKRLLENTINLKSENELTI